MINKFWAVTQKDSLSNIPPHATCPPPPLGTPKKRGKKEERKRMGGSGPKFVHLHEERTILGSVFVKYTYIRNNTYVKYVSKIQHTFNYSQLEQERK